MILALLLASSFVIDGGDIERRALPTPPADCAQAWAEVRESRRLIKNAAVSGGIITVSHMFDVATTAYFKHRFACKDALPGQPCIVEENKAFPLTVGLVAGKVAYIAIGTALEYLADRTHHPFWRNLIVIVASGLGIAPGVHNLVEAGKVR